MSTCRIILPQIADANLNQTSFLKKKEKEEEEEKKKKKKKKEKKKNSSLRPESNPNTESIRTAQWTQRLSPLEKTISQWCGGK